MNMFFNFDKNNAIFACWDFNIYLLNHGQQYITDNFLHILHGYGLYT